MKTPQGSDPARDELTKVQGLCDCARDRAVRTA